MDESRAPMTIVTISIPLNMEADEVLAWVEDTLGEIINDVAVEGSLDHVVEIGKGQIHPELAES
jgi:hypothetical protein